MTAYTSEEVTAELQAGFARTIALICNHLIDQKLLDRATLVSDLESVRAALEGAGVREIGQAVPAALAIALEQGSDVQP